MLAFRPIFPAQNAPFSRLSHPVAPISHALISLTQGAYLRSDGTFGDTSTESLADSTAPIPSAASRYSGASGSDSSSCCFSASFWAAAGLGLSGSPCKPEMALIDDEDDEDEEEEDEHEDCDEYAEDEDDEDE